MGNSNLMSREQVAKHIAKKLISHLSAEERNNAVLSVWYIVDQQDIDEGFDLTQLPFDRAIIDYFIRNEFDEEVNYGAFFDSAIIDVLARSYLIYNNAYLEQIYQDLYDRPIYLDEDPRAYHLQCPCCGFYSLSLEPAWEICCICLWENDGQAETKYSSVNRMTLLEYRKNFDEKCSKTTLEQKYISITSL